jgi:hypothetical protein
MPTSQFCLRVLQCPHLLLVQVRLNPYVVKMSAVASVAADVAVAVAEAVMVTTITRAMTTCAVIIRMEGEEVTTMVGAVEVGTHPVVEDTTGTKAGMEHPTTSLHRFRTHGHHHLLVQTSFPLPRLAGYRLSTMEVIKATEAMEVPPYLRLRSVHRGWATHLRNMVDHRRDRPVTTAP